MQQYLAGVGVEQGTVRRSVWLKRRASAYKDEETGWGQEAEGS